MSSTNRGTAREGLDRYYTPDNVAECLVSLLGLLPGQHVVEPSIGGGAFARACLRRDCKVTGIDVDPEAEGLALVDGLCGDVLDTSIEADWYIGNPPYKHAEAHLRHALAHAREGCAFLLRLAFLESARRYPFWFEHSPASVYVMSRRPSFTGTGTDSCAYAWFIWRRGSGGRSLLTVLPPTFGAA
jgi:hypothetical protein